MAGILKVDQIQNTAGVQIMDLQNDNLRIWNGSSYAEMTTPGALIGIKTYTSQNGNWADRSQSGGSGTWTKPAGCGHVLVYVTCLLYTSPSPRDQRGSRMPYSA